MSYKEIGRKLQQAREQAEINQEELARMLGCTQSALSNYELGKRRLYLPELKCIGEILGKSITYFLEDLDEETHIENKNLDTILKEPYLKDILFEVRELKIAARKSVLDYVRWQKSEEGKK